MNVRLDHAGRVAELGDLTGERPPELLPGKDALQLPLLGLVARTRLTLSQIDARIPVAHLLKRSIPTPWTAKGSVMRTVVEAAGDHEIDTTYGVRVVEPDRGWVLVLPDPADAVTHLWAEGSDADAAQLLLDSWAGVVEQAGR